MEKRRSGFGLDTLEAFFCKKNIAEWDTFAFFRVSICLAMLAIL